MLNYIIIAVIIILIIWLISLYNRLVKLRNNRENSFADIDVQLRQRHDLIPQLVEAVKGYMKHESQVLTDITNARANAMGASSINDKIKAENQLTAALGGLQVAVEAYPDLKASQNFMNLQEEISDIENKLAAARRYFNSATRELNNAVEVFPSNIVAGMFGFRREMMFEITPTRRAEMEEPPEVKF
ncbi:MAG: LemA family protein [Bacteroidales bacterium]|nr:LemA family protein [Bacteroidales bacterium]